MCKNTQGAFYSEENRLVVVTGGFKLASAATDARNAVLERRRSRAVKILNLKLRLKYINRRFQLQINRFMKSVCYIFV